MKIELLTKYYSATEIADFLNLARSSVFAKIKNLEITPDISVNNVQKYSYDKMRKICGFYEFEKEYWEIVNKSRLDTFDESDNFNILESKINIEE